MEIHYKIKGWMQISFPYDQPDKEHLIKALESGIHPTKMNFPNADWNFIYDSESILPIEENNGDATIELMEATDKNRGWLETTWDNSIKNEK